MKKSYGKDSINTTRQYCKFTLLYKSNDKIVRNPTEKHHAASMRSDFEHHGARAVGAAHYLRGLPIGIHAQVLFRIPDCRSDIRLQNPPGLRAKLPVVGQP